MYWSHRFPKNMISNWMNAQSLEKGRFYVLPFFKLALLYVVVGFVTRIVLITNGQSLVNFSLLEWVQIFLFGFINDLCIITIGYFFMWLCLSFMSDKKYTYPWGYLLFSLIGIALGYVLFFNTVFDEYGSAVPKIVKGVLAYKFISFGLRLFIPRIRKTWSSICYYFVFYVYVVCILFIAIGEYFFWDEFGVRYNFIAVDYLVYTNEVIGNIMESYPIIPLFSVLLLVSGVITYLLVRKERSLFNKYPSTLYKAGLSLVYFLLTGIAFIVLNLNVRFQNRSNVFVNELQANGSYKFCLAFVNSELSYTDFYITIPQKSAEDIINDIYKSKGSDNLQEIRDSLPEIHKNIVLITVESLSASFLKQYGNTENLTPNLDKLMNQSLVFNNLYAAGNRTVRGLEALSLCLPPSPGESIIKRPDNSNLFSIGKVLKNKGYTVQFMYGGDSYFDNMGTFFSGNEYIVIDKSNFTQDEISFSNIWGVCDEDMYSKAIKIFTEDAKTGKPFFGHIMTVSNHRPFTYPDGRIDIPSNSKSRNGGVKYTDYAIGKFMDEAPKQSWFDNTVFVIVADHCASSAGKTEIPLDKYHIPALIYAPGFVKPQVVNALVSQIDLMPTVFGLFHFSYNSKFYGKNIFSPEYEPKAFVATYQNLGYWTANIFTILSPVKKVQQYKVMPSDNYQFEMKTVNKIDSILLKQAVANYQSVDYGKK